MALTIYFFGSLTDIVGDGNITLSDFLDTDSLQTYLKKEYPALRTAKYFVAVNKKMIKENTAILDGDTIALMPAFSGG